MKNQAVPVFMYHTVGVINKAWHWSELTIDYKVFERQLQFLKKRNYKTIHLKELYNHLFHGSPIPKKSIILTFDDGYADNYVFAYPLLKKYGFKGTIFVNPEFVNPEPISRKKLFDEDFDIDSDFSGFLSWQEMLEMEKDGTIDIQSHALTHTWYPVSDEIIDFRHPGDKYIWMTWNDYPEKKYRLQFDDHSLIKFGSPVYKHEKSLNAKRYFPDEKMSVFFQNHVNENGGKKFFERNNWKEELFELAKTYKIKKQIEARYETPEERLDRIRLELENSKNVLESKLGKKIEFLCWPGGSGSKEGNEIAFELNYLMTTAAKDLPPAIRKELRNEGYKLPERIARTSPILIQRKNNDQVIPVYCDGFGMWLRIQAFNQTGILKKGFKFLINIYGKLK